MSITGYKFKFAGLFGVVGENGIIKNLGLENCNIEGRIYGGTLAATGTYNTSNKGTIQNCYATGTVKSKEIAVGLMTVMKVTQVSILNKVQI